MAAVIESLFPRYLFVYLDDLVTRGVMGLVASVWPQVPESVICELRARIDARSDCIELSAAAPLRCNQRVRIIKGPFADHEALFYARYGEDRASVPC